MDYDALLTAARVNPHEGTPLAMLSDLLQENGAPGGALAREGAKYRSYRFDPYDSDERLESLFPYTDPEVEHPHRVRIDPYHRSLGRAGELEVEAVKRHAPEGEVKSPFYLKAVHNPLEGRHGLEYRVPVFSKRHLRELTSDLTPQMQKVLHDTLDPHLPDDHAEQFARRRAAVRRSYRKRR